MVKLVVLDKNAYDKMLQQKPLVISYAFDSTQFGDCLVAFVEGKICHLSFVRDSREKTMELMKHDWPGASFSEDSKAAKTLLKNVFQDDVNLEVMVRGTQFQEKVWRQLLKIKKGETLYYSEVAEAIGNPRGHRAVASAVGRNPVSYIIPCHRVISKVGDPYKYGGGPVVKEKLLSYEGFKR